MSHNTVPERAHCETEIATGKLVAYQTCFCALRQFCQTLSFREACFQKQAAVSTLLWNSLYSAWLIAGYHLSFRKIPYYSMLKTHLSTYILSKCSPAVGNCHLMVDFSLFIMCFVLISQNLVIFTCSHLCAGRGWNLRP